MSELNTVMGRIDYSRQEQMDRALRVERDLIQHPHIIVGCGGVGFWLGIFLAMNGLENSLVLVDGDKLEATNLNRIPCPPSWIGVNKAIALRRIIKQMRPHIQVTCLPSFLSEDTLELLKKALNAHAYQAATVWDCTDDARIQTKVYKVCQEEGVRFRKIGYEGFKIGTYAHFDVWFDEATYQRGYRTTMANAMSSAMAAALGVFAEGLNIQTDVNVNIKKLMEPPPTGGTDAVGDRGQVH